MELIYIFLLLPNHKSNYWGKCIHLWHRDIQFIVGHILWFMYNLQILHMIASKKNIQISEKNKDILKYIFY